MYKIVKYDNTGLWYGQCIQTFYNVEAAFSYLSDKANYYVGLGCRVDFLGVADMLRIEIFDDTNDQTWLYEIRHAEL